MNDSSDTLPGRRRKAAGKANAAAPMPDRALRAILGQVVLPAVEDEMPEAAGTELPESVDSPSKTRRRAGAKSRTPAADVDAAADAVREPAKPPTPSKKRSRAAKVEIEPNTPTMTVAVPSGNGETIDVSETGHSETQVPGIRADARAPESSPGAGAARGVHAVAVPSVPDETAAEVPESGSPQFFSTADVAAAEVVGAVTIDDSAVEAADAAPEHNDAPAESGVANQSPPPVGVDSPPSGRDDSAATEIEGSRHHWVYVALAVFLLALGFGLWGLWTSVISPEGDAADLAEQRRRNERLSQEVSTLRRSDQISREANRDLQRTLAERDEEIAGLRADVAFYERFVGATGQRRGLSVHDLEMRLQNGDAWHFLATLTQNLNRGAVNSGRLTLSVEGTRNDRLERLSWSGLRKQNNAPGLAYSFKYFQQVEGEVILPKDFKPLRVTVRLVPAGGSAVEQSFPWPETLRKPLGPANPL